jgi:hypothetical protein
MTKMSSWLKNAGGAGLPTMESKHMLFGNDIEKPMTASMSHALNQKGHCGSSIEILASRGGGKCHLTSELHFLYFLYRNKGD